MLETIKNLIYSADLSTLNQDELEFFSGIDELADKAFNVGDEQSLLEAHRILYSIYMANLSVPWENSPKNLSHQLIAEVRFKLEEKWDLSEKKKHQPAIKNLPEVKDFPKWINDYVNNHSKNVIHPIFPYLRDVATYDQLKQFFLQETPLEMLFGDIMALMLPGVYGSMKSEITQNFWDEAGHAQEVKVHRYLRGQIMDYLDLPQNCYIENIEIFVREELELINTYLSSAMNRPKFGELIGIMLATELMIPGRFVYQIEGWNRLGVANSDIKYLTDHVTVDVKHAQDWLDLVVTPLLNEHPHMMEDVVIGCSKRLETAHSVCNRLQNLLNS